MTTRAVCSTTQISVSAATEAVEAAVAECRRIMDAEIQRRDDIINELLTGQVEASKILPKEPRSCSRCGVFERYGRLVAWSCEAESCPAGRPPAVVTVAEALKRWRS